VLLFMMPINGLACDICGCGLASNYMGILPQYRANSVGLRYSFSNTQSKHLPSLFEKQTSSEEMFHSIELLGRYYLKRKWIIIGLMPIHNFSKQHSDNTQELLQGLGDANVMVNYILLNTGDSIKPSTRHLLQVGGGFKAPTGQYHHLSNNGINPNFQLGTGAWAFITNGQYTLRKKSIGYTIEGSFQYHLNNKNNYQFGKRVTVMNKLFYWKKWRLTSIVPSMGIWSEYSALNKENQHDVSYSGGTLLNIQPGFDIFFRHVSLGVSAQIPSYQNLSNNYVTINNKYFLTFNYNF
jgi:hypothetical protein